MKNIRKGEAGSFHSFLSEGCELCRQGSKMVLFITGICPKDCFYCPVSEERRSDVIYANERKVLSDDDVLDEARQMTALGTGITGGEPLLKKDRVLHYIRLLKNEFGTDHHIHLYTSIASDRKTLEELAMEGLDEIRFHPPFTAWDRLENSDYCVSIRDARKLGIETGVEIPAIEGAEKVARFVDGAGCFLNLNELEFSDTNAEAMVEKGYSLADDISNAVSGSEECAQRICHYCEKIHFCSSTYKDAVQLRKRLIRIADNTARTFDHITEDGTVIYGHIECSTDDDLENVIKALSHMGVPYEMMERNEHGMDIAWWILEDISEYMTDPVRKLYIIERYPLKDGLIVEKIPL